MIGIDELVEDGLLDKADKPKKTPVAAADFVAVCSSVSYWAATSTCTVVQASTPCSS